MQYHNNNNTVTYFNTDEDIPVVIGCQFGEYYDSMD